jgi:putative transposase
MPESGSIYRADMLNCPLNAGKMAKVRALMEQLRAVADHEAAHQWQRFFHSRWTGFETVAKKGWSRPWVKDQRLPAIFGQMVMHQISGALVGHLGQVKNTYTRLVSGSSLPSHLRHQLHSLNRRELWFSKSPVTVKQVDRNSPGASKPVSVEISDDVRHLARGLIRKALSLHRRPRFHRFQFQLDQRAAWVQRAHTAQCPDWLMVGFGDGSPRLALPIHAHEAFQARNAEAVYHQHLASVGGRTAAQGSGTSLLQSMSAIEQVEAKARRDRNSHPSRFAVPNTVRLLLDADGKGLRIGVLTDMAASFAHQAATYQPERPGKVLCLDLGLSTLLATDDGELHGRGWMEKLLVLDRRLTGIARHRQRLGLKVSGSARYRATVQQLRGWLKTEIHRILNHLVARKRPEVIAIEALDFRSPRLSRRLNRLIQNFGQGVLTEKLASLEAEYGIVTERRFAAYSSQECHQCGYVDARNRVSQSQFHCQFCGLQQHADIQAARTLRDRRSVVDSGSSAWSRQAFLLERTRAFQERHTRPRGGPADPRYTNRYFPYWQIAVRSSDGDTTDPFRSSRASAFIHLQ